MRPFLYAFCFLIAFFPSSLKAAMQDYPTVQLQALDKSTARTETLEAQVGTTIQYGSLFIKVQACRKSEPLEKPESASFIQIWEVPINSNKSEWIFSGWMFASSPALSAMDHAVYDVWVLDCIDREKEAAEEAARQKAKEEAAAEEAAQETADEEEAEEDSQDTENTIESILERATEAE